MMDTILEEIESYLSNYKLLYGEKLYLHRGLADMVMREEALNDTADTGAIIKDGESDRLVSFYNSIN